MPVSDAKKISQLFKDKEISASTKDKLLYKSGSDLIETWSVYRQNRAERAKPAEPKTAPVKNEKAAKPAAAEAAQEASASTIASDSAENAQAQAAADVPASTSLTPIEIQLERMLCALPAPHSLTAEVIRSLADILPGDRESFFNDIDKVIDSLEKHLQEWKSVKEQAKISTQPSEVSI